MTITVLEGDMLEMLPTLEAQSFHAVVTDPPYELSFMSKRWDSTGIAFRPETWAKVLRVLKPGAYLVAFASTRGYHRMVCAIEDAGFVIHPMLGWLFGSGFPKGADASKAIDKHMGAATPEAAMWEGWKYGLQSLKPALDPICLAQRPMEGNGAQNLLKHGAGALNIDASRVPAPDGVPQFKYSGGESAGIYGDGLNRSNRTGNVDTAAGRYTSNVIHDGSPEVLEAFAKFGEKTSGTFNGNRNTDKFGNLYGAFKGAKEPGHTGDSCSPARFFYSSKANAADRADSKHPTIKPVDLMRYLVRLVTPPGGRILDPFAGSGTTGEAAMLLGFDCTLVERDPAYVADIRHRADRWQGLDTPLFAGVRI